MLLAVLADEPVPALTLSWETGHVTQVMCGTPHPALDVAEDRVEVVTSLGVVRNDPAQLHDRKTRKGQGQYVYQSEAFELTVAWTNTAEYAERVWSLRQREGEPFHIVGVTETLRFTTPFERIDLHTDGSALKTPINLFLRGAQGSLALGVTYPWVSLEATERNGATLSYEIECDVAGGETFESETTFLVPCSHMGVICDKGRPWPRITDSDPEPQDEGEVRAMQRYVAQRVPESPLPVDGYFLWVNCWWANLVGGGAPESLATVVPGTGIEDIMTRQVWWGHGAHPGVGDELKSIKPGATLALPADTLPLIKDLNEKQIHTGSFCSPANPYFGNAQPGWLSTRANGVPNTYIGNSYNCFANRAYVKAFTELQSQAITDSGGRFWAWDGRTLSFGEWDQGDATDRYQPVPCYAEGHGHVPGKQLFQEYRNVRWMIAELRRRHPRLCFQTYWGLKRGMPWIAAGLNAIEGYYEAESPLDQRLQSWYNQQYRYLPVALNWAHLESPDPKGFEVSLLSAMSMSTHCQIGKCWAGLTGAFREQNVATLDKWMAFAGVNRPMFSVARHLFGTPGSQWLDGTAHCIRDRGLLFLFRTTQRPMNGVAAIPLNEMIGLTAGTCYKVTQVHPQVGKRVGVFARGTEVLLAVEADAEVYRIEPTHEEVLAQTELPAVPAVTPAFAKGNILEAVARIDPSAGAAARP